MSAGGTFRVASINLEDHEIFEYLFEAFAQNVGTIQTSLDLIRTEIVNAEQFHIMRLSSARNTLLTSTLIMTIISMCTGLGSFVGSIFGMNLPLPDGLAEDNGAFLIVTLATTFGVVLGAFGIIVFFYLSGILSAGS